MSLETFQNLNALSETDRILILRGQSTDSLVMVIIKKISTALEANPRSNLALEVSQKLRQEALILARLKGHGAPRLLNEPSHLPFFHMEDSGGTSLDRLGRSGIDTLQLQLDLAIAMTHALVMIHEKKVFHRNLCPQHFIISTDLKEARLVSFGNAVVLSNQSTVHKMPSLVDLDQLYMSPELSGRMDKIPDFRADLYSLGAILFDLFTGHPPFESNDSLILIHSHIARKPPAILEKRPTYPPILSDIIDKLLAKTPEERYQMAAALLFDLQKLRSFIQTPKNFVSFRLGARDLKNQVLTNTKLFGRDVLESTLRTTWERVKTTQCEILWIIGPSGIGKSSVVRDFISHLDVTQTYIGTGKFQQFHEESTSTALYRTLAKIIDQILTESNESLLLWKQVFLEAVSPHGQLLIEILPDIQPILGNQPTLTVVPEADAEERFRYVLQAFTKALGKSENPLVIFLDDLQWIDQESTKILETIILGFKDQKVLFIGSYRGESQDPETEISGTTHPLIPFKNFLNTQNIPQSTHLLGPLSNQDVQDLLYQMLPPRHEQDSKRLHTIGEIIYRRTLGNPLFVKEQLLTFAEADLFWSDLDNSQWTIQLNQTNATNLADNIVDYILQKIDKLENTTLTILQYASLLGSEFSLDNLAIATSSLEKISGKSEETYGLLLKALEKAMAFDLVSCQEVGDQTQLQQSKQSTSYVFNHDRIHQAIHFTIPIAKLPQLHLAIGERLAAKIPPIDSGDRLDSVSSSHLLMPMLGHFRRAENLLAQPSLRHQIAKYCLLAMNKSRAASNSISAMHYADFGLRLLGGEGWSKDYPLTFQLADGLHGMASLCGRVDVMDKAFMTLNQQVKTLPELAHAYETKIKWMVFQGEYKEAITFGLEYVKRLGVSLPTQPTKISVAFQVGLAQLGWLGKQTENILNLPHCTNPRIKAVHRILSTIGPVAYPNDAYLFAIICLKIVRLSFKYGNDRFSPVAYCLYSIVLLSHFKKNQEALALGTMAMEMVAQPYFSMSKYLTEFYYYGLIHYLKNPLKSYNQILNSIGENLCQQGSFFEGHLALALYDNYRLVLGDPLFELADMEERHLSRAKQQHHQPAIKLHLIHLQLIFNLTQSSIDPLLFQGPWFNPQEMKISLLREQDNMSMCTFMLLEAFINMIFLDFNKCRQLLSWVEPHTQLLSGLYDRILYYSMFGHGILGSLKGMKGIERFFALRRAKYLLQLVYKAAKNGPDNYRSHYELLAAEWFRHAGKIDQAMIHYQKSLIWSQKSGLPFMMALTHEYMGYFWLDLGDQIIAKSHLAKARGYFVNWGAVTKAAALERAFPGWFTSSPSSYPVSRHTSLESSLPAPNQMLDIMSMIQVSQTLSSHASPDELVKKILKITLENAGATKGFLALSEGDTFRVKVIGDVGATINLVAQDIPVQDYDKVSQRIFQFVAHSKRPVLLDDALHLGAFTTDPYVLAAGSRSLICMPVMHLGEVLAIVWLENKHLAQAFTEERMELLNILAAQGAISLKNTEYLLKIPEKIRLESQLAAAQDVQKALLPKTPAPPEVSIALHHRAAERIGGDWLSYEMDEEASYLYLCIGDISGAGIPSALLTAAAAGAVKAAISNISRRHPAHSMADRLKIIAQSVNKTVRDTGNPSGRSMTMIFVVLDLTTGHGFFLNAGHIPILHFKKNQTSSLIVPGSLLGEHANPTFETKAFTLSQGDCLFLYTNGLLQNLGIDDHPLHHLALRRLLQTKIQKKQKEPTEVVKELLDQLDKKGALIAPKDDCSFLIIKLKDFRLNHKVKKPA